VTQINLIQNYLGRLGIEPDSSTIYIELSKKGYSSALQLAKSTGVSRTQAYRCLEALKGMGLVSAEQLSYGTLYRALPIENLEGLLANRESEIAAIRENLEAMSQALQHLAGTSGPKATVHHYYGIAGLKQVNWNLTKASHEFRVFEAAHLSQHLDKTFARRCRERFIERDIVTYDLTNATRVTAAEIEPFKPANTYFRHIAPQVIPINFEVYVYNDVVTLLDYSKEQQLALEIHHPALHAMMRQIFEAMWSIAKPLKIDSQ